MMNLEDFKEGVIFYYIAIDNMVDDEIIPFEVTKIKQDGGDNLNVYVQRLDKHEPLLRKRYGHHVYSKGYPLERHFLNEEDAKRKVLEGQLRRM